MVSTVASGDVKRLCRPYRHLHDVFGHRRAGHQPHHRAGAGQRRPCAGRHDRAPRPRAIARDQAGDRPHHVRRHHALRAGGRPQRSRTTTTASSSTPPAPAGGRWRSWSIPACSPASSTSPPPRSADLLVGGVLSRRGGPPRRDRPHRAALCRLVRRARHGQFRAASTRCPSATGAASCYRHNPQVTLMRTTPEENRAIGELDRRASSTAARARCASSFPRAASRRSTRRASPFTIPRPTPRCSPRIEATVSAGGRSRRLIRLPLHINDPAFADALVEDCSRRDRRPGGRALHDAHASRAEKLLEKFRAMIARGRADHRRRRRHRPVGEVRGGRRHRPHRHLQLRPLPHGRPRLARRAAGLRQRQRDRRGDGARGAAGGEATRRCWPASTAPIPFMLLRRRSSAS